MFYIYFSSDNNDVETRVIPSPQPSKDNLTYHLRKRTPPPNLDKQLTRLEKKRLSNKKFKERLEAEGRLNEYKEQQNKAAKHRRSLWSPTRKQCEREKSRERMRRYRQRKKDYDKDEDNTRLTRSYQIKREKMREQWRKSKQKYREKLNKNSEKKEAHLEKRRRRYANLKQRIGEGLAGIDKENIAVEILQDSPQSKCDNNVDIKGILISTPKSIEKMKAKTQLFSNVKKSLSMFEKKKTKVARKYYRSSIRMFAGKIVKRSLVRKHLAIKKGIWKSAGLKNEGKFVALLKIIL